MKCSVKDCTGEAETERVFEYVMEYNGLTLQTSGGLCKEHWQKLTDYQEPPKESTQVKYCVECGKASKASSPEIIDCPFCHDWCCVGCMLKHEKRAHAKETQGEEEEKLFRCFQCGKKLNSFEVAKDGLIHLCATCYLENTVKQSGFTYQWYPIHEQSHTSSRARTGCAECGSTPDYVCTHCNKPMCSLCYFKHRQEQSETGKPQSETCAQCGIHFYRSRSGEWPETHQHNGKTYCYNCWVKQKQYNPYAHRREYGFFTSDIPDEERQKAGEYWWRKNFGDFFRTESTTSTSTKSSQQQTQTPVGSELPTNSVQAFRILGIAPTSDAEKIKKAYRKLAMQHHPDKPDGDEVKMKQINLANDLAMKYAGKK